MNIQARINQLTLNATFDELYNFVNDLANFLNELAQPQETTNVSLTKSDLMLELANKGADYMLSSLAAELIDITQQDYDKLITLYNPLTNYSSPLTNAIVQLLAAIENSLEQQRQEKFRNRHARISPNDYEVSALVEKINNEANNNSISSSPTVNNTEANPYLIDLIKLANAYITNVDLAMKDCGRELINLAMVLKNLLSRKNNISAIEFNIDLESSINRCINQTNDLLENATKVNIRNAALTNSVFAADNYRPVIEILKIFLENLKNQLEIAIPQQTTSKREKCYIPPQRL